MASCTPFTCDQEIELKLELDADCFDSIGQSAALAGVTGNEREQFSTYYDTPDEDLRAAAVSLRIRRVGTRYIQTIKAGGGATAGMFTRSEWEKDIVGENLVLDHGSPVEQLLGSKVLDRLMPAFTVAVSRRTWLIDRDGATIELVADKGIVTAGGRTAPLFEIELELKGGPPAALFALARDLGRDVPLRLGTSTKAERGYRLKRSGYTGAVKAERLTLAPDATAAQAFAAIVDSCLRQFRSNEEVFRQKPNADSLHQARVALRRLRSALSIFKPVIADTRLPYFANELRWLARSLGDARDLDVLLARLGGEANDQVAAAHAQAYATAMAALGSQRNRDLMIDLIEWVALGEWRTRPADPATVHQPAKGFAAVALATLRGRIKRRGRGLAELGDDERHRVRILAKKLRYATGFFDTLFTGKKVRRRYKALLKQLEALQENLGELNDQATAPTLLLRFGLNAGPSLSMARRRDLLRDAADARRALIKAKRFW
jgi:inorganic triphosphatase YgiF